MLKSAILAVLAARLADLPAPAAAKDALSIDDTGNVTIEGDLRARSITLPIYDIDGNWEVFRKALQAHLELESRSLTRTPQDRAKCRANYEAIDKDPNPAPQNVRTWMRMAQEFGFKFDFKYKQVGEKRISFVATDTQTDTKPVTSLFPFGDLPVPSDARLKAGVVRLDGALERVRKLSGVTYHWNETGLDYLTRDAAAGVSAGPGASDEQNRAVRDTVRRQRQAELNGTQVGVLAQEVEAVLPEAVITVESGFKHVRYQDLIPLVIEAVKQQDELVRQQAATLRQRAETARLQEKEITRLQASQPRLEAELAELRSALNRLEQSQKRRLATPVSAPDQQPSKPAPSDRNP